MSTFVELRSSDNLSLTVPRRDVLKCKALKNVFDDVLDEITVIPVANVECTILGIVFEYLSKNNDVPEDPKDAEELRRWNEQFLRMDVSSLLRTLEAAHLLQIQELEDVLVSAVAGMIRFKTPEQIRKTFGIVNDFTPEEEEEVRLENMWAFA
jgi:S-phase kinase-associated protein 1